MAHKKTGNALKTALLSIGTTIIICILVGHCFYSLISRPHAVSGPMEDGCPGFTVVAMDGERPVTLIHEWSVLATHSYTFDPVSGAKKKIPRADLQSYVGSPIVWADTGRAKMPLRYYLYKRDLAKINSKFSNSGPIIDRCFRVKIIKDDVKSKSQTIKVLIITDRDDTVIIYKVKGERVYPVGWSRVRRIVVAAPVLLISPVILAISIWAWALIIRKTST
ncbi:MAG: hypothetical protein ABFD64_13190 [Armatimonadota bacterium]